MQNPKNLNLSLAKLEAMQKVFDTVLTLNANKERARELMSELELALIHQRVVSSNPETVLELSDRLVGALREVYRAIVDSDWADRKRTDTSMTTTVNKERVFSQYRVELTEDRRNFKFECVVACSGVFETKLVGLSIAEARAIIEYAIKHGRSFIANADRIVGTWHRMPRLYEHETSLYLARQYMPPREPRKTAASPAELVNEIKGDASGEEKTSDHQQ